MLGRCAPATESMPQIINEEMEEMLLRLGFSKMVAQKLLENQGIYSPWTLASLFNEDTTVICDIIRRPGGMMGRRTQDRGNQISVLVAKNLKLTAFRFKSMEHFSKAHDIRHANSTSVLKYQHQ